MTEKPLPGHEQQPGDITCSSCGRFVGALTRCPHCGARVTKRLSVRVTRYAAVVLATVGLGLLYLMAVHKEIPTIKIGEIKPTMNFAYVRVVGRVSSDARMFKQGGRVKSVRFEVDDGTGEIPVTAYAAQAKELVETKNIPRLGDQVSVAGSLSVSADERILMRLQSPKQLLIDRTELPVTPISELNEQNAEMGVVVEGMITDVRAPRQGSKAPWSIKLSDGTGEVDVSFWESVYADLPDKAMLGSGAKVRVRGSLSSYRGSLQLRLANGADLEFLEAGQPMPAMPKSSRPQAESVTLGEITADMEGQMVQTEGQVVEVRVPDKGSKAPYRVLLQDGDAKLSVVYWDAVATRLGKRAPVAGARLQVSGLVNMYKEDAQLKVQRASQIKLMDVSGELDVPVDFSDPVPVGSLSRDGLDEMVTVEGILGEPRSIRGGMVYPLKDDSGSVDLLLWDRQVPGSARDALNPGSKVTVLGKMGEYRGQLQIVPQRAEHVHLESTSGEIP